MSEPVSTIAEIGKHEGQSVTIRGWLYNHIYEVLFCLLVLEVIDITVTLRTFARKEAEQRAAAGRGSASPSP